MRAIPQPENRTDPNAPLVNDGFPRPGGGAGTRLTNLERRFAAKIAAWDEHLRRCTECLSFGEHLCVEGEYAAEEVEYARARLEIGRRATERQGSAARMPGTPVGVPS